MFDIGEAGLLQHGLRNPSPRTDLAVDDDLPVPELLEVRQTSTDLLVWDVDCPRHVALLVLLGVRTSRMTGLSPFCICSRSVSWLMTPGVSEQADAARRVASSPQAARVR